MGDFRMTLRLAAHYRYRAFAYDHVLQNNLGRQITHRLAQGAVEGGFGRLEQ